MWVHPPGQQSRHSPRTPRQNPLAAGLSPLRPRRPAQMDLRPMLSQSQSHGQEGMDSSRSIRTEASTPCAGSPVLVRLMSSPSPLGPPAGAAYQPKSACEFLVHRSRVPVIRSSFDINAMGTDEGVSTDTGVSHSSPSRYSVSGTPSWVPNLTRVAALSMSNSDSPSRRMCAKAEPNLSPFIVPDSSPSIRPIVAPVRTIRSGVLHQLEHGSSSLSSQYLPYPSTVSSQRDATALPLSNASAVQSEVSLRRATIGGARSVTGDGAGGAGLHEVVRNRPALVIPCLQSRTSRSCSHADNDASLPQSRRSAPPDSTTAAGSHGSNHTRTSASNRTPTPKVGGALASLTRQRPRPSRFSTGEREVRMQLREDEETPPIWRPSHKSASIQNPSHASASTSLSDSHCTGIVTGPAGGASLDAPCRSSTVGEAARIGVPSRQIFEGRPHQSSVRAKSPAASPESETVWEAVVDSVIDWKSQRQESLCEEAVSVSSTVLYTNKGSGWQPRQWKRQGSSWGLVTKSNRWSMSGKPGTSKRSLTKTPRDMEPQTSRNTSRSRPSRKSSMSFATASGKPPGRPKVPLLHGLENIRRPSLTDIRFVRKKFYGRRGGGIAGTPRDVRSRNVRPPSPRAPLPMFKSLGTPHIRRRSKTTGRTGLTTKSRVFHGRGESGSAIEWAALHLNQKSKVEDRLPTPYPVTGKDYLAAASSHAAEVNAQQSQEAQRSATGAASSKKQSNPLSPRSVYLTPYITDRGDATRRTVESWILSNRSSRSNGAASPRHESPKLADASSNFPFLTRDASYAPSRSWSRSSRRNSSAGSLVSSCHGEPKMLSPSAREFSVLYGGVRTPSRAYIHSNMFPTVIEASPVHHFPDRSTSRPPGRFSTSDGGVQSLAMPTPTQSAKSSRSSEHWEKQSSESDVRVAGRSKDFYREDGYGSDGLSVSSSSRQGERYRIAKSPKRIRIVHSSTDTSCTNSSNSYDPQRSLGRCQERLPQCDSSSSSTSPRALSDADGGGAPSYACDKDPLTGRQKPIRITVYPFDFMKRHHFGVTYGLLGALILFSLVSIGYDCYLKLSEASDRVASSSWEACVPVYCHGRLYIPLDPGRILPPHVVRPSSGSEPGDEIPSSVWEAYESVQRKSGASGSFGNILKAAGRTWASGIYKIVSRTGTGIRTVYRLILELS